MRSAEGRAGSIDAVPGDLVRPFREWQAAVAALRAAEAGGDDHADIVHLSAEVIRTRNALTLDRIRAGWDAPDDVVRRLVMDEQLLLESDGAGLACSEPPSVLPR